LLAASWAGHIEVVRSLLGIGAGVDERDENNWTPLHFASQKGTVEVAKLLIEYGADANSLDRTGWRPLHLASYSGHACVVRLLLDHGADVNAENQDHLTALHYTIINTHSFEIAKTLLERGANVHVQDDLGQTPFQIASRKGQKEIMQLLSEYGVDGNLK
jgi:ankyrin repeat protein